MSKGEIIKELYILSKKVLGNSPATFQVEIFDVTIPAKGKVRIKKTEMEIFYFVGSLEPVSSEKFQLKEEEYLLLKNAFFK